MSTLDPFQTRYSRMDRSQKGPLECAKAMSGQDIVAERLQNELVIESLSLRVRMALALIEKRYADPNLRLDSVAGQVRVSSHHLSSLIKKETGKGFRYHLIHIRLKAARFYLTTSLMSVKEIATLVGYGSTSSFDREFRRNFECSPTEVRRQDKKNESSAILLGCLSDEMGLTENVNQ